MRVPDYPNPEQPKTLSDPSIQTMLESTEDGLHALNEAIADLASRIEPALRNNVVKETDGCAGEPEPPRIESQLFLELERRYFMINDLRHRVEGLIDRVQL